MEQIINDLKVALEKINAKSKEFAEKSAQIDIALEDVKNKIVQLDDRDAQILSKEALYAEYDSVDNLRAEIKSDKIAIAKDRSEIASEKANIAKSLASIASDRVELDKMLSLYKKKLIDCDNQIKQLAEDKKNLEKKVVEELTKKLASK